MAGSLRRLLEHAELDDLDAVADRDPAGLAHFAVDPERNVSLPRLVRGLGPVGGERPQGVEVRDVRFRVLRRDRAAADVAAQAYERLADPNVTLDPAVLLVRRTAFELEEHPEAAAVDGAVLPCLPAQLLEGCARDHRDMTAPAIDSRTGRRLDEAQR